MWVKIEKGHKKVVLTIWENSSRASKIPNIEN